MNVDEVQRKLWEQSKEHKEHRESGRPLFPTNPYEKRVRSLMDLMHQPDWLCAAMHKVLKRSRNKASGVDKITAQKFAQNQWDELEKLRLELKRGTYRPQPLRRVKIPKANGKMRPLGIPCLRDKIVQEAIRMALEPIFEIEFHENSYGFRPNRNTHHAVARCQNLMGRGFTWVIEGDVKACFDEISHKAILAAVREKVMDNKFLSLIDLFLKAGVMIEGVLHPTVKGVPQGGIISPLLANAVLNKLDWFLHSKGMYEKEANRRNWRKGEENTRFVRYADDWCVFLTRSNKERAAQLKKEITDFLEKECGLQLSEEKTHVTHVRDGFDFLGFHLEVSIGQRNKPVPKIKVGAKAITNIRKRIDESLRYRAQQESMALRIRRTSKIVRGWSNYFCIAHNFANVAGKLDHYSYWSGIKAFCRKHEISNGKCHKKYVFNHRPGVHPQCILGKFSDTKMSLDYRGPKPYEPGNVRYETDLELEVDFGFRENGRFGSADVKWEALKRDKFQCCECEVTVTAETSEADHIKPVKRFASFAEAHRLENIQTLCLNCHRDKSKQARRKKV